MDLVSRRLWWLVRTIPQVNLAETKNLLGQQIDLSGQQFSIVSHPGFSPRNWVFAPDSPTFSMEKMMISSPWLAEMNIKFLPVRSPSKFATEAAGQNISGASAQTVLMRSIPRPGCSFRGKAYRDPQVKAPNGGYVDTAEMCQEMGIWDMISGGYVWIYYIYIYTVYILLLLLLLLLLLDCYYYYYVCIYIYEGDLVSWMVKIFGMALERLRAFWRKDIFPHLRRTCARAAFCALASLLYRYQGLAEKHGSMDWFKGKFTGKPHILWENLWFPVDFPLNQSIEWDRSDRESKPTRKTWQSLHNSVWLDFTPNFMFFLKVFRSTNSAKPLGGTRY